MLCSFGFLLIRIYLVLSFFFIPSLGFEGARSTSGFSEDSIGCFIFERH